METAILRKKISLLDPSTDAHIKQVLHKVISQEGELLDPLLKEELRSLFLNFFARLCKEEGVSHLSHLEDENSLKDHLPDTVANWLTVLSEIFSARCSVDRVEDPLFTAAVLLIRLHEWITLNYERRFVYGNEMEEAAEKRFLRLENEMDLIGDKDEIVYQVMDALSGFCSNYWFQEQDMIPGVNTYYLRIDFDYGQGVRSLEIGMRSVLIDQVKFRALCPDQHILAHILESLLSFSTIGISPSNNYI